MIGCLVCGVAEAQDWASAMFDHTSHDFRTVARAAKVEHHFPFTNKNNFDIHIASVQSSCSCTQPELTKQLVRAGDSAEVIARVDTRTFSGRREATVRVTIDQPVLAEVQLHVYCNIRGDIVVNPGEINFGSVDRGTKAFCKVVVNYAGSPDWRIIDVQSGEEHLAATIVELNRAFGQVTYELTFELKDNMPEGYLKDHVILVTNDPMPDAARVPIAVEALVLAPLSVKPALFSVGALKPAETVTKHLVMQEKVPFRVVDVAVPDKRFRVKVPSLPSMVQSVAVTFQADDKPGQIVGELLIRTDLPNGETLKVPVLGEVLEKDGRAAAPTRKTAALGAPAGDGWRPAAP
jgi:hypothetical protein